MSYILNRLKEASTWRGIIMFASGTLGYTLPPQFTEVIITVGVSAAGAVGFLFPDKK